MQREIKDSNSTQALIGLLQSNQVSKWEVIYRADPFESPGTVEPSRLNQIYSHRLTLRDLEYSPKSVEKLASALSLSKFRPAGIFFGVRLGMRFYDFAGKVVFEFYTGSSFSRGIVNGQTAIFEGKLPAYLKGFVAHYFEG